MHIEFARIGKFIQNLSGQCFFRNVLPLFYLGKFVNFLNTLCYFGVTSCLHAVYVKECTTLVLMMIAPVVYLSVPFVFY
jgi:hypothetical protein